MVSCFIEKDSKTPIYKQLYEFYRNEMHSGNLKEGTKLPSVRALSVSLGISKNTVNEAYQQLVAEGYIESRLKKGYWVVPNLEFLPVSNNRMLQHAEKVHTVPVEMQFDFQYGDVDLEHFPMKIWKKCLQDSLEIAGKEVLLYGNKQGSVFLRQQIATYLYRSRGIKCNYEDIVISAGTNQLIRKIVSLFSDQKVTVAMENPGYDGVKQTFISAGCDVRHIPVSVEFGYDVQALKASGCKTAYITPSHQFPLGTIMPAATRLQVLKWAEQTESYIIEDDYDSEFRYEGAPIASLKGLDRHDRVIYAGTFSKSFLPSIRISYMVLPKALSDKLSHQSLDSQNASPILQHALALFMERDHFDRHLRKMKKIYKEKYEALNFALQKHMGNKIEIIGGKAGLHLLINVYDRSHAQLIENAWNHSIGVYSTASYYTQQTASHCPIILGFGGLSVEEIKEGIDSLATLWFGDC
ncbi:PLP-dependent aminotransferase family protein [Niallia circulans]|uniref:PLP-dependent aminotransferase family protein n=1 Tax=Niallia circulans TaxID=1397 RepID=A0A553SMY9_NIACI|nr:PLP-dependent aminotransferase family protein [Niallia circulans]TRZ38364.1 PLP-dependent aminotransferase family protein [Niallia circulans]